MGCIRFDTAHFFMLFFNVEFLLWDIELIKH